MVIGRIWGCGGTYAGVDTVVVPMVVPVAVPVTRSNDQGFGKRNRSNPAPRRTTPTLRTCLPRAITPPAVAGRALAIYCPHSAGSQHKYVTPMATPTAHGSRIPPPASGRTAKRITRINAINAVPSFYARRLFLVATVFFFRLAVCFYVFRDFTTMFFLNYIRFVMERTEQYFLSTRQDRKLRFLVLKWNIY